MTTATLIEGEVKNGVVVLKQALPCPDGTRVCVVLSPNGFTEAERVEFEAWDKLGDEAWRMIEQWEKEEQNGAR